MSALTLRRPVRAPVSCSRSMPHVGGTRGAAPNRYSTPRDTRQRSARRNRSGSHSTPNETACPSASFISGSRGGAGHLNERRLSVDNNFEFDDVGGHSKRVSCDPGTRSRLRSGLGRVRPQQPLVGLVAYPYSTNHVDLDCSAMCTSSVPVGLRFPSAKSDSKCECAARCLESSNGHRQIQKPITSCSNPVSGARRRASRSETDRLSEIDGFPPMATRRRLPRYLFLLTQRVGRC